MFGMYALVGFQAFPVSVRAVCSTCLEKCMNRNMRKNLYLLKANRYFYNVSLTRRIIHKQYHFYD